MIVVGILLYGIPYLKFLGVLKEPQVGKLIRYQKDITTPNYENIPVEELLGKGGFIEVLDENNNSIYISDKKQSPNKYTERELEYIMDYPSTQAVYITEYKTDTGEVQIMVSITQYLNNELIKEDYVIIDDKKNIIASSKNYGLTQFTQREFNYLTGTFKEHYRVQKYVEDNGYKVIIYMPDIDEEALDKSLAQLENANYIFVLFYIVMLLLFVLWLNQKVKKPLVLLNGAIGRFASGEREIAINYNGPYEFVEICESFNEMSKRLLESEKKSKALEEDRQKMLADISHDLKTPITIIQGYSKAICDGIVVEEKVEQYLTTIYQKSNRLTELINTFYEYSKLEHPEFKLNLERRDVCEYIRAYLIEKYNEINLLGFELDIDISEEVLMMQLDTVQLRRAFENILVNAMKHNPKGTTLYVRVYEKEQYIVILLADNGLGIPQHLTQEIFNPFVVGDESRNYKQGSGLGLAITKCIIEAHGGHIRLVLPPENTYPTQFEITFLKES